MTSIKINNDKCLSLHETEVCNWRELKHSALINSPDWWRCWRCQTDASKQIVEGIVHYQSVWRLFSN